MNCPKCQSQIPAEDVNLDTLFAKCRYCNEVFSFAEPVPQAAQAGSGGSKQKLPAPQPENILVEEVGDERRLIRRWFVWPAAFMVFFCIAWDSFLVFWYWMAFHNPAPGPFALLMIIFPVAHVAVGVGITYFTIATLANRTVVTVAGNDLRIRHGPVPWRGNRNVDASTIIQLYCDQVISNSNRGSTPWSYRVNALLNNERRLRLLSGLDKDQALFYEQKLEEWLGIEPYPVKGAVE